MEGGVTQFCLTISQLVRVAARNMYFSILKWSRFIKSDSGSVGNQSGGSFSASNVVHLQEKEFQLLRKKVLKHRKHKRQQQRFWEKFQPNLDYKDKFLLIFLRPQLHLQFWRISIGYFPSKLNSYSSASKYTPFIRRLTCSCLFHF